MLKIPKSFKKNRNVKLSPKDLIDFEDKIIKIYNEGKIRAPIHLSKGNEKELIKIFSYISRNDWVFSSWRSHYHALLHGISPNKLEKIIIKGKSMGVITSTPRFYSSSIVGGSIPIALGTAISIKRKKSKERVFCFLYASLSHGNLL